MIIFTDLVLKDIDFHIASHDPERGGALLGPPNTNVITTFIPDFDALTTHATYRPSNTLGVAVKAAELQDGLLFRGIIHSHPPGIREPSLPDLYAFQNSLRVNGHLPYFVAPIITTAPPLTDAFDLPINDKSMRTFLAYRSPSSDPRRLSSLIGRPHASTNPVRLVSTPILVMHIGKDVDDFCTRIGAEFSDVQISHWGFTEINYVLYISTTISFCDTSILLFFSPIYPLSPPIALFSSTFGDVSSAYPIEIPWSAIGTGGNSNIARWIAPTVEAIRTLSQQVGHGDQNRP